MARALIVDDSAVGRLILGRLVRRAGWHVEEADGGEAALELLERDPPDIVFLDLLMPGLTGVDVLREAQRRRVDVPIVVVTAEIQSHHRSTCEELGAHAYLNKPVNETMIAIVLESAKAVVL
jgi:CheY-like chemotaxis protein